MSAPPDDELSTRIARRDLWRLLALARPHRRAFAACLLLALAATACELALPWLTKLGIDRAIAAPWREAAIAPDDPLAQRLAATGAVGIPGGMLLVPTAGLVERDAIELERRKLWSGRAFVELPAGEAPAATPLRVGGRDFLDLEALRALPAGERLRLRSEQARLVVLLAAAMIGALVLRFACTAWLSWMLQATGQRIIADLRRAVVARLLRLPAAAYDRESVGRLVTRATNDVGAVNELFTSVIVVVVRDVLLIVGGIALLLAIEWRLALVVIGCAPLVLAVAWAFRKRARDNFRDVRAALARLNGFLAESLAGWRTVQACAQEERMHARFQELNLGEFRVGLRQVVLNGWFMPLLGFTGAATAAAVLWAGGHGVSAGWLTLGGLVAFLGYVEIAFGPIRELAEKHNLTQAAVAAGERIFQILDRDPEEPGGDRAPAALGGIALQEVWFRYDEDAPWAVAGVTLAIAPGEQVALVGATGSGKSTIAGLLLRLHDPQRGRIVLGDGTPLASCRRAWLRTRIATVQQEVHLFAGTVVENVALFADLPRERIAAALAAVGADAVVARLPGGLDHRLSERGAGLSSGERQLLALARAVAHDPELLILDEATAHIDSASEQIVQQGIARLLAGRSALVVAHRPSTVRRCHRIVVLHHGRIAEEGDHDSLLARGGLYADLHRKLVAESALPDG
jgi:ATP-binding cassette subfamily B protein